MAFLRRAIDLVNSQIQFEVNEPANSVNLKFDNGYQDIDKANLQIRVERVSKNSPNQTLYSGKMSDLKSVLKFAFPDLKNVLPFAVGKTLLLDEDNKLLITMSFPPAVLADVPNNIVGVTVPASFEFEINKTVVETNKPLILKKIEVAEEASVNSEMYQLLLVPKSTISYETIVLKKNENNQDVPQKVYFGNAYLNSQIPSDQDFASVVTSENQKFTVKGDISIYLILL